MCLQISTFRIRKACSIFKFSSAILHLTRSGFFFSFPAMKSEMSAEEAQMFQWQFDKMRHKHIILPQNTHTNMYTCTVSSMTVQDSITTLNTKDCILSNSIVAVWRASESLTLDVILTGYLWQQTLAENTYSMHAHAHTRTDRCDSHRTTQRNCCESTSVNHARAVSPSAAVCRYTVSKAGPLPHRAQGLMGVLGGTISGGRMCTGGVRGEHAQFTGGLTTRLTTPVTLAPNEKHN